MKLKADYRIREESVEGVPLKDRPALIINEFWRDWGLCRLCDAERREAFLRRLTRGQRAFLFVLSLESQVESDGFYLYLWNSGEEAAFAVEALSDIGALKYSVLLGAALAMFRSPQVLESRRMRRAELKKHAERDVNERFERSFDALNGRAKDCLATYLLAYLKKHPEEFFLSRDDRTDSGTVEPAIVEYRVPRSRVAKLRGEKLHCALLELLWDDYCAVAGPQTEPGSARWEKLISTLTAGQRALAAVKLFDRDVHGVGRIVGFGTVVVDLARIHGEILAGYRLLGAQAYAELFGRVVERSRQMNDALAEAERQVKKICGERKRLGIGPGDHQFGGFMDAFWKVHDHQMRLHQRYGREQRAWLKEYLALDKVRSAKLERLVEAYVASHPSEFFRNHLHPRVRTKRG